MVLSMSQNIIHIEANINISILLYHKHINAGHYTLGTDVFSSEKPEQ